MASNISYSPKEFKVLIKDQAAFGTSVAGSGMYQLDVDSISAPSLNNFQNVSPRDGRTLESKDFQQDRTLSVKEVTFTGIMHKDDGHKLPLMNLAQVGTHTANSASIIPSHFAPSSNQATKMGVGEATMDDCQLFTIVIAAPDVTNGTNLELIDCVCTNFQLSADTDTDGGLYKFSATFQTGSNAIDLDDATAAVLTSINTYVNTDTINMGNIVAVTDTVDGSDGTALKVLNTDCVLKSFSVNVDCPAVFVGAGQSGFQVIARGQECSVAFDSQVKYDGNTDEFINTFDSQTAATGSSQIIPDAHGTFATVTKHASDEDAWLTEPESTGQNTTLVQNTTTTEGFIRSGASSGKLDLDATTGYLSYYANGLTIGKRYRACIWLNEATTNINIATLYAGTTVRASTNSGYPVTVLADNTNGVTSDKGWFLVETDFTAVATSTYIILKLTGDASGVVYIDDFSIREAGEGLYIPNSDGCSIFVNNYAITNVAISEGDIMMLDVSGKAVDSGLDYLFKLIY